MNLERDPIGSLEDVEIFERANAASAHPLPDPCYLFPDIRSFGAWLEPRYIFGAGCLI